MAQFVEEVRREIEPVVTGLGFSLVEVAAYQSSNGPFVRLVVYRPRGFGIRECSMIARTVRYQLQLLEGMSDLRLEVSSPGTGREIRSAAEYRIFRGKRIKILMDGSSDWENGVIDDATDSVLYLRQGGTRALIPIASIRRSKLDDSQKEEEQ